MANLLLLLARRIAAILKAYFARVTADGGTTVDRNHTKEVYADVIDYEPSLIQSCDSGKAGTLYSIIPSQELLLYQYTGAAAAYSLRSLSAGTINVVKVRRSGDNAELDFTATEGSDGTLASWVTAGGGTEDGFVTTWYDQSGNGHNFTQATAASQPQIVSSGSLVTENGKAALNFDSSLLENTDTIISSPSEMFVSWVAKRDSANEQLSNRGLFDTFGDRTVFDTSVSGWLFDGNYSGNPIDYSNTQKLVSLDLSSPTANAYINSAFYDSDAYALSAIDTQNRIGFGGSSTMIGYLQEFVIWEGSNSANRTGIEANINDYYNIYP